MLIHGGRRSCHLLSNFQHYSYQIREFFWFRLISRKFISDSTPIFRFILTGVSSWGIGCGEEGVPGVYTSIKSNLCFIDWATKCKHGRKYNNFYNYREDCKNWFDELIDNMRRRKQGELAKKALAFKNESCISLIDLISIRT